MAVVRFIKDYDKGKEKHIEPSLTKMIRKNRRQYK